MFMIEMMGWDEMVEANQSSILKRIVVHKMIVPRLACSRSAALTKLLSSVYSNS